MLLGSQGEWSDSVWAGQCKCNPQLFKEKKKPDTELGAHCWQINSIILVYTRPHIIQGGLAERGKLAPSCHQLSRLAPLQLLTSAVVTVFLQTQSQGAAWSGQEQKALFTEVRGNKEHVYTRENVILRRPSVPPAVLALEDARYGPYPWTGCLPLPRGDGTARREAFPSEFCYKANTWQKERFPRGTVNVRITTHSVQILHILDGWDSVVEGLGIWK